MDVQFQRRTSLITPSLFLACFASFIPQLVTSLLLVEIGLSFAVPVGVAGQILSAASGTAIVLSLLMGSLSVRYSSKTLLGVGLGALSVMAVCAGIAPSFLMLLISFLLYGVSLATIQPQSFALIGQYYARARLVGAAIFHFFTIDPTHSDLEVTPELRGGER